MKFGIAGMVALIIGAMAFAYFEPIQVLPRIRLAPGFALEDQSGDSYTSETNRGAVTLYTFVPLACGTRCDEAAETMRTVKAQVDAEVDLGTDLRLVTVVLGEASSADLERLASDVGADGTRWRVVGHDDPELLRRVVGDGFERFYEASGSDVTRFDPGYTIVDGNGIIRGEYSYGTLADDADKLGRHLGILADEIRYANGATAVAYEAAHLFLCYP